jgi:DNA-binding NtrC family response regulator
MGSAGGTQSKDVLVVDDEPGLRLLCRVNLELEGHTVREASTLAQAREQLHRQTPDVVFLDIHIGLDDGLELLDEIEALDLPTRVVLLSGTAEVGPALRRRVSDVVGKPFELKRLASAVLGSMVR